MSTLKVDAIRHNSATSDAITMASDGTCTAQITGMTGGGALSHRNKFINGAMRFSQRATSFTSTLSDAQLTLDRFKHIIRGTNDSYYYQVTDHPEGFSNSMKVTCNSTHTPSGSDNAGFQSFLEGQDLQDLNFGTSNAKSFTVSFYAKSASQNNGHQYTFQIRSYPTSGDTRIKNFPFTVTTSWQRFSFTFTGDTGADIANTNGAGFACLWNLNAGPDDITSQYTNWTSLGKYMCVTGQSNFLDNTNNEFYLTGVQLEVGDTATSFEHISYGEELRRCERYFQCCKGPSLVDTGDNEALYGVAHTYTTSRALWSFIFKTEMRDHPTIAMNTIANLQILSSGGWNSATQLLYANKSSKLGCRVDLNFSGTPFSANGAGEVRITGDGLLSFDAEI